MGSDDWNPRCVLTDHSPSHGWGGAKCRIVPSIRSWHAMTQCLAHVIETQAILSIPGNTPIHTDRQTDRQTQTHREEKQPRGLSVCVCVHAAPAECATL